MNGEDLVLDPAEAKGASAAPDPSGILNTLPAPVLVVDRDRQVRFANAAAEQFLRTGLPALRGRRLDSLIPADSPLFDLIEQVWRSGRSVNGSDLTIESPRIGTHYAAVACAPMGDPPNMVVMSIQERSIARKIEHQLSHRNAARSVTAMAAMLAHEVKNPLSGIRGAAQLLEQSANGGDRELTRLICDEADRIVALVDRMEMFSDERPIVRAPVNIHEVLSHVRRLAQSGFAAHVRFVERYDPSLPPVHGNRDLLVQAVLNLVKNAAEAVPPDGGEIVLMTRYEQGVRLALPGREARVDLPLSVTIQDNGAGVPE
ncbi:MAG: PAS domain-containing protein, partial [Alphaproteobacteria bacterium]